MDFGFITQHDLPYYYFKERQHTVLISKKHISSQRGREKDKDDDDDDDDNGNSSTATFEIETVNHSHRRLAGWLFEQKNTLDGFKKERLSRSTMMAMPLETSC